MCGQFIAALCWNEIISRKCPVIGRGGGEAHLPAEIVSARTAMAAGIARDAGLQCDTIPYSKT
jgi:hypothetical protein